MVSNKKQLGYVLAAIAAIGANAEEGALQTVVGGVDTNRNGVGKVGGPGSVNGSRIGSRRDESSKKV